MTEAVTLFQGICSNTYFERSSIILFLNKKDLFAEKLAVSHVTSRLPRERPEQNVIHNLTTLLCKHSRTHEDTARPPVFVL